MSSSIQRMEKLSMRLLTILLMCAILLTGCWTGAERVSGVYYKEKMNGEVTYFVDLVGRDDAEVTLLVYQYVLEYAKDLTTVRKTLKKYTFQPAIICDFEYMPRSVWDDIAYCDVGR